MFIEYSNEKYRQHNFVASSRRVPRDVRETFWAETETRPRRRDRDHIPARAW